jgi:tyrosine-protein phosphatase non-receptor type 23
LDEISALRSNSCIRPMANINGITALKKYYCQLHFLQNRFKIKGGSEDGPFAFPWADIYSGSLYTFSDLHYEMASVLYNIGSLHSQLGRAEERSDSEGMKLACTHFQCSAWAFSTLPDKYTTDTGTDLSSEILAFLAQVILIHPLVLQPCVLFENSKKISFVLYPARPRYKQNMYPVQT